jgi:hypothetical protein
LLGNSGGMPNSIMPILEFLALTVAGAILGILAHVAKSHMDPFPDQIFDKGDPLNVIVPDYDMLNLAVGNEYDDAGYWEYLSLRNLLTYVLLSVLTVWTLRYLVGGIVFRDELCREIMRIGLTPLFCNI